MDPIKLPDYECCGDCTFDVLDTNLGNGPASLCKETADFLRDVVTVYRAKPPRRYYKQRARIACVWCGACQVVKLTDEIAGTDKSETFPAGKYKGKTPAEVYASGQDGRRYVESCAEHHPVLKQHQLAKDYLNENRPELRATGKAVAGGRGDNAVSGGGLRSLDDCGASERGVLGTAETLASLGWRRIGRVGANTGGDQGGV